MTTAGLCGTEALVLLLLIVIEIPASDPTRADSVVNTTALRCSPREGLFEPTPSGSCLRGMNRTAQGCCSALVYCNRCGPGYYRHNDSCHTDCLPCGPMTFSNQSDNTNCLTCTVCARLYRQETAPCRSDADAICGECLPGFYKEGGVDRTCPTACSRCCNHENYTLQPECLTDYRTSQYNDSEFHYSPPVEDGFPTTITLIFLTIMLILFLVILLRTKAVERCLLRRRGEIQLESHSDTDPGSVKDELHTHRRRRKRYKQSWGKLYQELLPVEAAQSDSSQEATCFTEKTALNLINTPSTSI